MKSRKIFIVGGALVVIVSLAVYIYADWPVSVPIVLGVGYLVCLTSMGFRV
jgi:hypothetical protein